MKKFIVLMLLSVLPCLCSAKVVFDFEGYADDTALQTAWWDTTANVTVLIPPAVEPGEPPINISKIRIILLDGDMAEILTVLKPAVLAVID